MESDVNKNSNATYALKANKKAKDSVFTSLFDDIKNIRKLYNSFYDDGDLYSDDDFVLLTLENTFVKSVYNDLGFQVGNKIIVLVEAQSTFNPNMPLRLLIYYAYTIRKYIINNSINIYSTSKKQIPNPDFYMVYTGNEEIVQKELSLSDMYVNKDGNLKLEAVVKIIKEEDCNKNILWEYIRFSKIHTDNLKQYQSEPLRAIRVTIEYCIENGILAEYLQERKVEVKDMLMSLMTEDEIVNLMLKENAEMTKFEVAKSMLLDGFDYKTIAKHTKISESDFKKIQQTLYTQSL